MMPLDKTPAQQLNAEREILKKFQKLIISNAEPQKKVVINGCGCVDTSPLTYYNNGKVNACCKGPYDYVHSSCEGYDHFRHRDDRKHPHFYMHINLEEEYPCRTVPLLTNSNYGHRSPIEY